MPGLATVWSFRVAAFAVICWILTACGTSGTAGQPLTLSTDPNRGYLGLVTYPTGTSIVAFLQMNQVGDSVSGMLTVYSSSNDTASGPVAGTVNGSRLILWTSDSDLKQVFVPALVGTIHGTTITVTYDPADGTLTGHATFRLATVADYNRQVRKLQS